MTRWFNGPHLRNACGITSCAKTLYCFRHTITTLADRCWVPPSIMRTINGHSDGRDVENQSYVARGTLMECKHALEKLPFPQLDLEPYVSERFAGYLAHVAEEEKHRERLEAEGKAAPQGTPTQLRQKRPFNRKNRSRCLSCRRPGATFLLGNPCSERKSRPSTSGSRRSCGPGWHRRARRTRGTSRACCARGCCRCRSSRHNYSRVPRNRMATPITA